MANTTIVPGTSLGFKVGTQSSLNALLQENAFAAVPGHFYLTEDTHRLYVGNSDKSLSPVNQGIQFVRNLGSLPPVTTENARKEVQGQFYYVEDDNILCIFSGDKWVQINPDTYLKGTSQADPPEIKNSKAVNSIVAVYKEDGAPNTAIVKTRVQDTNDGSTAVHTAAGWFSITGGKNVGVTLSEGSREITLDVPDGALYELKPKTVNDESGYSHRVDIELIETKNGIKTVADTISLVEGEGSVYPVLKDGKIELHGGGLAGATVQMKMEGNKFVITLIDSNGSQLRTELTPVITIGDNEKVYFTYENGVLNATLNVYTKDQIDAMLKQKLNSLDAMYFAGTIGSPNGTVTNFTQLKALTNLHSGATFKLISTFDISDVNAAGITLEGFNGVDDETMEPGDLIIITGTEDSDGNLVSGIKYTYVPSGNDVDLYFQPNVATQKEIKLTDSSDSNRVYKLKFTGDEDTNNRIQLTGTVSSNSLEQTIKIAHAEITPTKSTGTQVSQNGDNSEAEYSAITGITVDKTGHITDIQTTKLKLWSNQLTSVVATASVDSASKTTTGETIYKGKISKIYYDAASNQLGGIGKVNDWQLSSDTLKITQTAKGDKNTTADLSINMVWGSFGN